MAKKQVTWKECVVAVAGILAIMIVPMILNSIFVETDNQGKTLAGLLTDEERTTAPDPNENVFYQDHCSIRPFGNNSGGFWIEATGLPTRTGYDPYLYSGLKALEEMGYEVKFVSPRKPCSVGNKALSVWTVRKDKE